MNIYDIAPYIAIAVFAGLVGYYLGKIWSNKHAMEPMLQQSHYWRFRYYQTLEDLQNLEDEAMWLEDWCPDEE